MPAESSSVTLEDTLEYLNRVGQRALRIPISVRVIISEAPLLSAASMTVATPRVEEVSLGDWAYVWSLEAHVDSGAQLVNWERRPDLLDRTLRCPGGSVPLTGGTVEFEGRRSIRVRLHLATGERPEVGNVEPCELTASIRIPLLEGTPALRQVRYPRAMVPTQVAVPTGLDVPISIAARVRTLSRGAPIVLDSDLEGELQSGQEGLPQGQFASVHLLRLAAGDSLTVDMTSQDFDAFLIVSGPQDFIRDDDDGGEGLNSRLSFRAPADGDYYVVATSFQPQVTGRYRIRVNSHRGG
jgi:hypothetical protein